MNLEHAPLALPPKNTQRKTEFVYKNLIEFCFIRKTFVTFKALAPSGLNALI